MRIDVDGQPRSTTDRRIAALAERQHGVVARRQLLAAGVSAAAVRHRLEAGRLHALHAGVYAVGHRRLPPLGPAMAAVLAAGPAAVASHATAAALWDLRAIGSRPVVTVRGQGARRRPGVRVHLTRALAEDDRAERHGIPCTGWARTLLDLAAEVDRHRLLRLVEASVTARHFDLAALEAALARHERRAGVRRLRGVLAEVADEPDLTRSAAEDRLLALVAAAGLPRPRCDVLVAGHLVDAVWRAQRYVLEVDGWRFHRGRVAFERDRRRDQDLRDAGFVVERVTARQLTQEPDRVAALLARRLAVDRGG